MCQNHPSYPLLFVLLRITIITGLFNSCRPVGIFPLPRFFFFFPPSPRCPLKVSPTIPSYLHWSPAQIPIWRFGAFLFSFFFPVLYVPENGFLVAFSRQNSHHFGFSLLNHTPCSPVSSSSYASCGLAFLLWKKPPAPCDKANPSQNKRLNRPFFPLVHPHSFSSLVSNRAPSPQRPLSHQTVGFLGSHMVESRLNFPPPNSSFSVSFISTTSQWLPAPFFSPFFSKYFL